MLIRWAVPEDKPAWQQFAAEVAFLFDHPTMATDPAFITYMDGKIARFEALVAIDRMTERCLGVIGFSRTKNHITWFAVSEAYRGNGIGTRLLKAALRHLDNTKSVTVITFLAEKPGGSPARAVYQNAGFVEEAVPVRDPMGNLRCQMTLPPGNETRGRSFHYQYPDYAKYAEVDHCLCCNHAPMPDGHVEIAAFAHSSLCAERNAQGRLFGKCYLLMKKHHVHFEDIPYADMTGFMHDLQIAGKALRTVTGAVKINYEMHANSGPHMHCHLFPRYLDDDFPSAPIDYRICEPSPYENEDEFLWFIDQMRHVIQIDMSSPDHVD